MHGLQDWNVVPFSGSLFLRRAALRMAVNIWNFPFSKVSKSGESLPCNHSLKSLAAPSFAMAIVTRRLRRIRIYVLPCRCKKKKVFFRRGWRADKQSIFVSFIQGHVVVRKSLREGLTPSRGPAGKAPLRPQQYWRPSSARRHSPTQPPSDGGVPFSLPTSSPKRSTPPGKTRLPPDKRAVG